MIILNVTIFRPLVFGLAFQARNHNCGNWENVLLTRISCLKRLMKCQGMLRKHDFLPLTVSPHLLTELQSEGTPTSRPTNTVFHGEQCSPGKRCSLDPQFVERTVGVPSDCQIFF